MMPEIALLTRQCSDSGADGQVSGGYSSACRREEREKEVRGRAAQAAEERLQAQRDRERMAAARKARMELYRQGFQ